MKFRQLYCALMLLPSFAYADGNFEKWTLLSSQFGESEIFDITERTFSNSESLVYEKSPTISTEGLPTYIGTKGVYPPNLAKSHPLYGISIDSFVEKTDSVWSFSPYATKSANDIKTIFNITTLDVSGKPIVETVDTARHYLKSMNEIEDSAFTENENKWLSKKGVFPQGSKCVRFESIIINTPYLEYNADSERVFSLQEITNNYSPPRKIGNVTFYLNLEDEESSLVKINDKLYNGSYTSEGNYYSRQDEISMIDQSISEAQENNELGAVPLYQAQQKELELSCNAYNDVATTAIFKLLN